MAGRPAFVPLDKLLNLSLKNETKQTETQTIKKKPRCHFIIVVNAKQDARGTRQICHYVSDDSSVFSLGIMIIMPTSRSM